MQPLRGASPSELQCWGRGQGRGSAPELGLATLRAGGSAPSSEGPGVPPGGTGYSRPVSSSLGAVLSQPHPGWTQMASRPSLPLLPLAPSAWQSPSLPDGPRVPVRAPRSPRRVPVYPAPQLGPPGGAEAKDRPRLFSPACLRLDRPLWGGGWSLLPCPPGAGLCPYPHRPLVGPGLASLPAPLSP